MKTGFSLLEILHREIPVFITGMGLQCCNTSQFDRKKYFNLTCLSLTNYLFSRIGSSLPKLKTAFLEVISAIVNYLHSTLGKQGGGSSEHSGLLIRQALHSCNALASNMVSCF